MKRIADKLQRRRARRVRGMFASSSCGSDRRTDGQPDRRTDRQTDRQTTIPITQQICGLSAVGGHVEQVKHIYHFSVLLVMFLFCRASSSDRMFLSLMQNPEMSRSFFGRFRANSLQAKLGARGMTAVTQALPPEYVPLVL